MSSLVCLSRPWEKRFRFGSPFFLFSFFRLKLFWDRAKSLLLISEGERTFLNLFFIFYLKRKMKKKELVLLPQVFVSRFCALGHPPPLLLQRIFFSLFPWSVFFSGMKVIRKRQNPFCGALKENVFCCLWIICEMGKDIFFYFLN